MNTETWRAVVFVPDEEAILSTWMKSSEDAEDWAMAVAHHGQWKWRLQHRTVTITDVLPDAAQGTEPV